MKLIVIAGMALALGVGAEAWAEDEPAVAKVPPAEVSVKVQAPEGTSEQDIAAAIASESAKREPGAQHAAHAAKQKADADTARSGRVAKICDSIPEKSMRDDPSLRKLCQ